MSLGSYIGVRLDDSDLRIGLSGQEAVHKAVRQIY